MKLSFHLLAAAALTAAAGLAQASTVGIATGNYGDLTWTAKSNIVGVTSTATGAGGGDPRYFANTPQYNGVASMIMTYANGDAFICTGSLMSDRRSILTAAHCVSDGGLGRPVSTVVNFYTGGSPDAVPHLTPTFSYAVEQYAVHSQYTGSVIDQNDIAVLLLDDYVDRSLTSYELFGGDDLTGLNYNVAGYGGRSDTGGSVGQNLGTGRLRQGDNRYDFRLGDADFGGDWALVLDEPAAQIEYTYLSDFDSGRAANDLSCNIAIAGLGQTNVAKYCDRGRGATEASIAGGDSGGPGFINGMISSVNSFGLSFGRTWGDVDTVLNSSYGEFNGFVPVSIHRDFINANMVPEPGSYALAGLGLFLLGMQRRRRAGAQAAAPVAA